MNKQPKSTAATLFIRFEPAHCPNVRRHHLEQICSEVGPLKKTAVIHDETHSYAFCKFISQADAERAAKILPGRCLTIQDEQVKIHVELASPHSKRSGESRSGDESQPQRSKDSETFHLKKHARIIIRNLSFYAKESHIRQALQGFGEIVDIHVPQTTHKQQLGFAFCTFAHNRAATAACAAPIVIKGRPVQISMSVPKNVHQQQNTPQKAPPTKSSQQDDLNDEDEEDASDDDSSSGSGEDSKNDSQEENVEKQDDTSRDNHDYDQTAVQEKRCLFLRNLPFDVTRHDLFTHFCSFGYITGIYLVKDSTTGLFKGTAFVSFQKVASAEKALATAMSIKGRNVFISMAVHKDTAQSLTANTTKSVHVDRRNLYLKTRGRVDNHHPDQMDWDALPDSDQQKRQAAWSDKNTKLQSPLFYINSTRLSIRNLAKHVTETDLKQFAVEATMKGMRLVTPADQVAHWRASGDFSARDIVHKIQEMGGEDNPRAILPVFDPLNVKKYIPSVFINRDFSTAGKEGPSRGFGFVEFEHHVHALACLEQLNNNVEYSAQFVAGGKHAVEMKRRTKKKNNEVKIPRLIVEFAVENKVKAKQQAEHRAAQQANKVAQKKQHPTKTKKKKSRGALQRERKRKQHAEEESVETMEESNVRPIEEESPTTVATAKSTTKKREKPIKPKKKPKMDQNEQDFNALVESYKRTFAGADKSVEAQAKKPGQRWFD